VEAAGKREGEIQLFCYPCFAFILNGQNPFLSERCKSNCCKCLKPDICFNINLY
jgi:hypothetical protein